MALMVEDGLGRDCANSYASLECADDYCVPHGLWPAAAIEADGNGVERACVELTARKEACLMRAFDWLNTLKWKGEKLDWEQPGAWPRKNVPQPGCETRVIGDDVIPRQLVMAQYELAGLIYGGINPLEPLERGGKIISESHSRKDGSVDVLAGESISDSYSYAESAPAETYFPAVAGYLRPFLMEIPGEKGAKCAMLEADSG